MTDRLRDLWDFDDLDATERRMRAQLARETDDPGRAEVLTQLARVAGLRGDFAAGERLIEDAAARAGDVPMALARIDLERGRLRRSGGSPEDARPLFGSAFDTSLAAGASFLAADAAHMLALVAPDRAGFADWTERGIELAASHDESRYWLGPLLNNLGWERYEHGEYEPALDAFAEALRAREQDPGERGAIEIARYAVGKTLRALGRAGEAIPLLEGAVAWADGEGTPDGWFHEELAEEYAAVGRVDEARVQAERALPLLLDADASFADDTDRTARLRALASGGATGS